MNPLVERSVEYLLSHGADPNARDADGNFALWLALQWKGSEKVVKMLLEKGAECAEALESEDESSSSDDEGDGLDAAGAAHRAPAAAVPPAASPAPKLSAYRPLPTAASVRALRKAGAHPSLPNTLRDLQSALSGAGDVFHIERGSTVDLAMQLGTERHVLMLLRAGHVPNRHGRVRLVDFARLHGFGEYAASFLCAHLWTAVREADASRALDCIRNMDKKIVDSRTPLYACVESKDPLVSGVTALLQTGADPNHVDISHTPMAVFPLCRAAKKSTLVLSLLCRFGLRPDTRVGDMGAEGQTLLEFAHDTGARAESIAVLTETLAHRQKRDKANKQQQGTTH